MSAYSTLQDALISPQSKYEHKIKIKEHGEVGGTHKGYKTLLH
jgi:hypothetical protein